MAPRKRQRADNASSTTNKRQKTKSSTVPSTSASVVSSSAPIDLTALNATNSPLLALPAELRNRVWTYAYGGNIIYVEARDRYPDPNGPQFWQRCLNGEDQHGQCRCLFGKDTVKAPVPSVCKQFWSEARGLFYSSNTFYFYQAQALQRVSNRIPVFIRAFQQHQLEEQRTTVTFVALDRSHLRQEGEPKIIPFDAQGIDKIIKNHILDYRPRRRSKRGQQEE